MSLINIIFWFILSVLNFHFSINSEWAQSQDKLEKEWQSYKKVQVATVRNTNTEYQIWSFSYNFFWAVLITNTHIYTHKPIAKNAIFGFRKTSKQINLKKLQFRKFGPKTIHHLPCVGKRMQEVIFITKTGIQ